MMRWRIYWLLIVSMSLSPWCRSFGDSTVGVTKDVDPKADRILKTMGQYLANAKRISLVAYDMTDEVLESGQKIQLANTRRVTIQRPNRAWADLTGDIDDQRLWYDGKTVTVLDRKFNVFGVVEVPDHIDQMLDHMVERFGVVFPLADLLLSDPYASAVQNVRSGRYMGLHTVRGISCHHLAFRQDGIDWQIWIENGDHPLPRKLVITFLQHPGAPQYIAILDSWDLSPSFKQDLFVFKRPEGVQKVDFEQISARKQLSPLSPDRRGHEKDAMKEDDSFDPFSEYRP